MTNQKPKRVIYRYEIPIDDAFHGVPAGAIVLAAPHRRRLPGVEPLGDRVEVWVLQEPGESEVMELIVVGTGQPVEPNLEHEHSLRADPFIWHIFSKEVTR